MEVVDAIHLNRYHQLSASENPRGKLGLGCALALYMWPVRRPGRRVRLNRIVHRRRRLTLDIVRINMNEVRAGK